MPQFFGFDKVTIRGPKPAPIIGKFTSLYELLDDPLAVVMRLRRQGDVVALIDQSPALICVFGPDRNREILTQPAIFRHDETLFHGPPGSEMEKMRHTIISINGETHKRHRKLMQPSFHKGILDGYTNDIVSVTRVMLDRWKVGEVNLIDDLCRELAIAMAMKCFYGLEVGDEAHELGHIAAEWVKSITEPTTILMPLNIPGLGYHKAVKLGDAVGRNLRKLIEKKRNMGGDQKDAMAVLMNARDDEFEPLSDDELVAEAVTLFIAGHETTAMTLVWTLFLLERHPAVHSALRAEINSVLGKRDPSIEDIAHMALLDRVIKESMRILSSVPLLFFRVASETSSVGGYNIPKGTNILISPLGTHHDPALYPEPNRFLPDRWFDLNPSPYSYLPFGAGPRICMGMPFADRALRLMLTMILQRFQFSIPAGTQVDRLTRANILQPRQHLPMLIESASAPMKQPISIDGNLHELVEF
jgi:cytochrome P450